MTAWEILGLEEGTWDETTIRQAYQYWHAEYARDWEALARVEAAYQWLMTQLAAAGDLDEVFNDIEPDAGLSDFDVEAWVASNLATPGTNRDQIRQDWLQHQLNQLREQINDWPTWYEVLVTQATPETALPPMDFWTGVASLPLEAIDQLRILQALLSQVPRSPEDRPEGLYQRLVACWTQVSQPYKGFLFWGTITGAVSAISTLVAMALVVVNWLGLLIWPQAYPVWLTLAVCHLLADHCFTSQMSLTDVRGLDAYFLESPGYRWYAMASLPLAVSYLVTLVLGLLAVFWPVSWLGAFGWASAIFIGLVAACLVAEHTLGNVSIVWRYDTYNLSQLMLMVICAGLVALTVLAWLFHRSWSNALMIGLAVGYLYLIGQAAPEKVTGRSLTIQCLINLAVSAFLAAWRLYQGSLDLIPQILWVWMALSTLFYLVGCAWIRRRAHHKQKEADQ